MGLLILAIVHMIVVMPVEVVGVRRGVVEGIVLIRIRAKQVRDGSIVDVDAVDILLDYLSSLFQV